MRILAYVTIEAFWTATVCLMRSPSLQLTYQNATENVPMIVTIVRSDRFCEGLLLRYLGNGMMLKWMKRLKEIDDE